MKELQSLSIVTCKIGCFQMGGSASVGLCSSLITDRMKRAIPLDLLLRYGACEGFS